jgi:hypothetical protein
MTLTPTFGKRYEHKMCFVTVAGGMTSEHKSMANVKALPSHDGRTTCAIHSVVSGGYIAVNQRKNPSVRSKHSRNKGAQTSPPPSSSWLRPLLLHMNLVAIA